MVNLLSDKDLSSEEKLEKLNNINDRSDFINSFDKLFIPDEITNSRTNTQEKTQTKDEEEEEPKEFNNINQKIEPKENKEIKKPKFIINHIHKNKIKDIKAKKHTNKSIIEEKRVIIDDYPEEDEENGQMIGGGVFNTPDEGEVEEEELEEKKPVKKEIVKSKKKKYTKGTTTKLKDSDMDGYFKKVEDRKKCCQSFTRITYLKKKAI